MSSFIKKTAIGIYVISMSITFLSCKKFLSEKSDKRLVELRTLTDLQAMLDDNVLLNIATTPGISETSADDYFLRMDDYNSLSDFEKKAYTWRLDGYKFKNDWSYGYQGAYVANYCLDYIEKIAKTSENTLKWDNVKGSALFYRAFIYLNLVWVYGKAYDENSSDSDLGIVLKLNSDPSVPSVRSTVKESYDRAIKDAKESIQYLPDNPLHVMRPSKGAAYGLLARAYLSMRIYDSAFKYADLALNIKNSLIDFNSSAVDPSSMPPFQPFNEEIIFYTTQSQAYWPKNPYIALIDSVLYDSYDINDQRRMVFFYENNGYHSFQGTYSTTDIEDLFTGIATDEMYLVRAECHARSNPARISEALDDLNALLIKRWVTGTFVPYNTTTQEQTLDLILSERRKELLMRGLRWIDIKRLNKEGRNIQPTRIADQTYTLPPNDNKYALPLPQDIIELTGIPQN